MLSKLESRFLRMHLNIPQSKISIINNGFTPYAFKKSYSDFNHPIKVITVGAIYRKEKGIDFLINTLGLLSIQVELTICNFKPQKFPEFHKWMYYARLGINLTLAIELHCIFSG